MILQDRTLIEIAGEDRKKFLQGLITNDVNKATAENLIYAVMLNAQGRFLYDFFIFEKDEKLMLDCFAPRRDEILQKLSFYKLRSKVTLQKNDELQVSQNFSNVGFPDPRHPSLGHRSYAKNESAQSEDSYHLARILNKIPESEHDLTYEKSFILEFGFDELNAIDYKKGCYIGQELTARTHYLGQIRKKVLHIKIVDFNKTNNLVDSQRAAFRESTQFSSKSVSFLKGVELTCEGKSVGIILSSLFHESELHALALIKLPQDQEFSEIAEKLEYEGHKIFIVS